MTAVRHPAAAGLGTVEVSDRPIPVFGHGQLHGISPGQARAIRMWAHEGRHLRAGAPEDDCDARLETVRAEGAEASPPAVCETNSAHQHPVWLSWARLLKRVFEIGLELCPNCGAEARMTESKTARRARNAKWRAPLEPAAIVQGKLVAAIAKEATRHCERPRTAPTGILLDAGHDSLDAVHLGEAVGGDVAQIFRA